MTLFNFSTLQTYEGLKVPGPFVAVDQEFILFVNLTHQRQWAGLM